MKNDSMEVQMTEIKLGNTLVGDGHPCYVVAEIGINHNGSIDIAKKLIDAAAASGCQAVKFQKRTVDVVYSAEELARLRESPFGTTNGDLKYALEFGLEQYREIDRYCQERNIGWFASCWDEASVDFIDKFNVSCYKIASACLTDDNLLRYTRAKGRPILLSTGMSTLEQIDHAVEIMGKKDLILLHTCSTYPASYEEINLRVIPMLRERFGVPVGYSGHETGLSTSITTIALGVCVVERHITLDRAMWGSDQAASVEPQGFGHMVRDIRLVETALGDGIKRISEREEPIMKKLRRIDTVGSKGQLGSK
jgi:N-acetylneuraminate synthase